MNYIKELDIKNTYTNKILKLKFSEGTNVIIGPKGGGKSTLLNLIYALYCKGKLLKETKEALQTKHLDPESVAITYSNGEIVTYKQLSNISSKDGIITQSDDIKTELHNTKKIEKAKDEFVEIIIKKRAKYIIELFEEYFKTFFDLYQLRSDNVSWTNINKLSIGKDTFFTNLNDKYKKEMYDYTKDLSIDKRLMNTSAKSIALLEVYKKINESTTNVNIKTLINLIDEVVKIHNKDYWDKVLELVKGDSLRNTGKYIQNFVKNNSSRESSIPLFKSQAKEMFSNMGKLIAKNVTCFNIIMNGGLSFNIDDKTNVGYYDLQFYIKENIEFEQNDESLLEILNHSLRKAKKDPSKYTNWLYASFDNDEPTRVDKNDLQKHILGVLKKKVSDKVKLLADGKDYNKMSLGTKTSFGLTKKITNNKLPFLFLDQPEDNIDSSTIYRMLIPLIEKQMGKDNQIFIVTHNANFGINLDTKTITLADLDNHDEPYEQFFDLNKHYLIRELQVEDSPIANYLEGGSESLIKRYKKIIKENK